ncbi:MAG: HD domain-containing protein [Anaerolineales bacterium]|nr:HD domain-containing protein [Anaerolineales bacterium]
MKRLISNRFVSIRTKIILPFLLLALALAIAAGYMAWQAASDSIQERFVNQLIEVGKLANEGMVRQEDQMLETLRLLANTSGMPEAITNRDTSTLRNLALPLAVNTQEDAVIILGIDGVSVLSMYHRPGGLIEEYIYTQGDDGMRPWQIVQLVIQRQSDERGDKFAAYHETPYGNYLFICGPVLDENQSLVGAVLIGRSTDKLVQELRNETLAQITLYDTMGRTVATTFLEPPVLGPLTSLGVIEGQDSNSTIRTLTIADIQYSEIMGAWKARGQNLGVMGASFSQNFLVRMGKPTWLRVVTLVSVAALLVIAIGIFISTIISRPILQLEKAASAIGEGNLGVRISSTGHDEVASLTREFNLMVERLQKSRADLIAAYDSTIEGWAKTLEARDYETLGHSHRVVDLTLKLARTMGISEDELVHVRRGAFLHDIGKLVIPDSVLQKAGPLTKEEWEIIRKHPTAAYEFLKDIEFLEKAINIPYCHHEYWNGSGYPRGLKGTEIPLEARIFTVIDQFDGIRSERPYHPARSVEEALKVLGEGRGTLYDPQVFDTFLEFMQRNGNEPAE